jgi:hypothetical protein
MFGIDTNELFSLSLMKTLILLLFSQATAWIETY